MLRKRIYPEKPDDQSPVCPHCNGSDLTPQGHYKGNRRYKCRACNRTSYGVPDPRERRLSCTDCGTKLREERKPDGRTRFRCSQCGKTRLSAYNRAPHEASKVYRYRHVFTVTLDRHARAGLVEYVQAKRCTDAQAVRAIFRYVLTGKVFFTGVSVSGRPARVYPVPRNPQAAAMKFPNLCRESALRQNDRSNGYHGRGFQVTVIAVAKITVNLDDEAKEGLVYAMCRLNKNHADAARWLLANVRVPGAELAVPIRTLPPPNTFVACSGRRISAEITGAYDPRWDD